jgi:DNA mismatch repair protein MutS2
LLTGPELSQVTSTLESLVLLSRHLEKGESLKGSSAPEAEAVRVWRFLLAIEPALMERLRRTVSARGEVLDTASPGLAAVRARVGRHREEVRSYYRNFLLDEGVKDALQDHVVTERDGRMVVPVKRERQSRVPGLLHALSSSGSTAFVEPEGAVVGNNHLREALLEEEAEILKVLAECTRALLAHRENLDKSFAAAAEVDAFGALARFAAEFGTVEIIPAEGVPMKLLGARHPLLALQVGQTFHEVVIPLDLSFENNIMAVLVSGPNAGRPQPSKPWG